MEIDNIRVTGVMFYYYFVCKRKLWYFSKGIQMESTNENVMIGKLIDETTYKREKKHIMIDGVINIDFINNMKVINEIKKSKSIEEAGQWQLKYYIYYLKIKGIEEIEGLIDYPLLKQRVKIELTQNDELKIKEVINEIKNITTNKNIPDKIENKICKSCAYYELCYI